MDTAEIVEELTELDRESLSERVKRAGELEEIFPIPETGYAVSGGMIGLLMFQGARISFLHGLWIPSILASLTAVEHHLAAELFGAGLNAAVGMPALELVEQAAERRIIDGESALLLVDTFERGDIYRRFHEPIDFARKVVTARDNEGLTPDDMMEQDARTIIRAAGEYFVSVRSAPWFRQRCADPAEYEFRSNSTAAVRAHA
jgi:hypothetical protein